MRLIDADALREKQFGTFGYLLGKDLAAAPTIDPSDLVPKGRWIEWRPPKYMVLTGEEKLFRCSVCDAKYAEVEGYRFCPYCGADMRERAAEGGGPYGEAGQRERKRKCGECQHGKRCYFPGGDYVVLCKKLSTEDDPVYRTPVDGCPARMKEDDPDAEA